MKFLALWAIRSYQKWISPHKGFSCAYRHHTGCASCSALGHRAIRIWGVWKGLFVLQARLVQCGRVHQAYRENPPTHRLSAQRGDCDLDCGGCDAPDFNCDVSDCWPSGKSGGGQKAASLALDVAEELLPENSSQKAFAKKTRNWPQRKPKQSTQTAMQEKLFSPEKSK